MRKEFVITEVGDGIKAIYEMAPVTGEEIVIQSNYKNFEKNKSYSGEIEQKQNNYYITHVIDLTQRREIVKECIKGMSDKNKKLGEKILTYELENTCVVDEKCIERVERKLFDSKYDQEAVKVLINKLSVTVFKDKLKKLGLEENNIKEFVERHGADYKQKIWALTEFGVAYRDIVTQLKKEEVFTIENIIKIGVCTILYHGVKQGHVYLLRKDVIEGTWGLVQKDILTDMEMIEKVVDNFQEVVKSNDSSGREIVYLSKYWDLEERLVELIRYYNNKKYSVDISRLELANMVEQSPNQAISNALTCGLSIVTGGAGTGKTTLIKNIVSAFKQYKKDGKIRIVAPTGRAVERISGTEVQGVDIATIHRTLNLKKQDNTNNIVSVDLCIVDEASMMELELCVKLLEALADNEDIRIVLVGDPQQLPSIGVGQVLQDLINVSHIPEVLLTKVYRQDEGSLIVSNANKIAQGETDLAWEDQQFTFIECKDSKMEDTVISLLKKGIKAGVNLYNIQILCAVKELEYGTAILNQKVQELLHMREFVVINVGDKVIHTKNDYEKEVYNGEIGIVTEIIEQPDKEEAIVYYKKENSALDKKIKYDIIPGGGIADIEVVFATTIHKMQGSEEDIVIVIVPKGHEQYLNRRMLYVAVTRAKKGVALVGDKETFVRAVQKEGEARNSLLALKLSIK